MGEGSRPVLGFVKIQYKVRVMEAGMILSPAEMNWSHKQTGWEDKRSVCLLEGVWLQQDKQQLEPCEWITIYLLQLQEADVAPLLRTPLAFWLDTEKLMHCLWFQTLIKFIPLPPGPHK